ncbi:MAG TPA: hypothetical protein VFP54_02405 [Acidimicrobiales bacterium]|nr:hypothetical protein [Acidimicrobiales bacterium]
MKVIAVDWSGAASRRGQHDHIWTATAEDGRLNALSAGRTRHEVIDFLIAESRLGGELVVGVDFAFSFPAWFARQHGIDEVGGLCVPMESSGGPIMAARRLEGDAPG